MHLLDRGIVEKKGWKNHGIFQRGRLGKLIFMFFSARSDTKDHAIWTSEAMEASFKNAPVGWNTSRCSFMCEKPRNSRCTQKIHVALLHQFVKNSPTWKRSYGSLEILTHSQTIIGERQDTKIRNPEPMLKDCTPPAALTLEK